MRRLRGFTLVELLVVFAIVALLASLVPVAYDRVRQASEYRDTVRGMLTQLRAARYRALSEGRETRFIVDLQQRTYAAEGGSAQAAAVPVPESIELRATVAGIETRASGQAAIRFLPDGGATGGSIDVVRASGVGTRLRVDWLSGRVTLEALGS